VATIAFPLPKTGGGREPPLAPTYLERSEGGSVHGRRGPPSGLVCLTASREIDARKAHYPIPPDTKSVGDEGGGSTPGEEPSSKVREKKEMEKTCSSPDGGGAPSFLNIL